jgi:N4-gp56 family major capsid protein
MPLIVNSGITADQEKYLAKKLIDRSYLKLSMSAAVEKVQMREGSGLTAFMVRYQRMATPQATLTEGVAPPSSTFSLQEQSVTLDQWGDWLEISDVAQLTAMHPIMEQARELLADNAARVMDREITVVMLAGTSVVFGDGSVASRRLITSAMRLNETVLHNAKVSLSLAGAPPIGGPAGNAQVVKSGSYLNGNDYLAIAGPEVCADLMQPAVNLGTFVSQALYANQKNLYNNEVGKWLGFRFVESNFLPRFGLLGNTTVAVTAGNDFGTGTPVCNVVTTGGSFNGTIFFKITRKNILRGFEEDISIAHTIATGGASRQLTFTMPATAGFVYNVYVDTTATGGAGADSGMRLVAENALPSALVTVSAAPTVGRFPPDNINATSGALAIPRIHPVFLVAQSALAWVGFYDAKFYTTGSGAEKADPLAQKRTVGWKFFGKTLIRDQDRLLRLELATGFGT